MASTDIVFLNIRVNPTVAQLGALPKSSNKTLKNHEVININHPLVKHFKLKNGNIGIKLKESNKFASECSMSPYIINIFVPRPIKNS